MKIAFTILLVLALPVAVSAQVKYYFDFFHDIMDANQKVTYVGGVWENALVNNNEIVKPLTEAEGGDGYVAEALIDYNLPIFQKRVFNVVRKDDKIIPFLGYSRFRLNYGFNVRILNVASSPILPPTNRFGFAYDFPIFFKTGKNNIETSGNNDLPVETPGYLFKFKKYATARFDQKSDSAKVQFWYGTLFLNHYSNGQDGNSFIDGYNRNNYLSGDFSTNHIQFSATYNLRTRQRSLYSINLGYQREIELNKNFLQFSEGQKDARYGLNRLTGFVQCRTGLFSLFIKKKYLYSMLRAEWEGILDRNLENFPYENKYRWGYHVYYKLSHLYVRSASLVFHYYQGRDYLNIRYDNPVRLFQVGLSFEFNQWTPPLNEELADKGGNMLEK